MIRNSRDGRGCGPPRNPAAARRNTRPGKCATEPAFGGQVVLCLAGAPAPTVRSLAPIAVLPAPERGEASAVETVPGREPPQSSLRLASEAPVHADSVHSPQSHALPEASVP